MKCKHDLEKEREEKNKKFHREHVCVGKFGPYHNAAFPHNGEELEESQYPPETLDLLAKLQREGLKPLVLGNLGNESRLSGNLYPYVYVYVKKPWYILSQ